MKNARSNFVVNFLCKEKMKIYGRAGERIYATILELTVTEEAVQLLKK